MGEHLLGRVPRLIGRMAFLGELDVLSCPPMSEVAEMPALRVAKLDLSVGLREGFDLLVGENNSDHEIYRRYQNERKRRFPNYILRDSAIKSEMHPSPCHLVTGRG